ncbi:MAG: Type 1 glutamine amidotransferase-like domain-containing protein [Candidatus Saccharibacteria bacterium]
MGHVQQADVIYFHGGDNETLVERMKAYPDIAGHLEGKIVIGSSAGATIFQRSIGRAAKAKWAMVPAYVPVAVMVHYGSLDGGFNGDQPVYWVEAEAKLRGAIDSDTELLRIREGEFAVVEL